MLCLSQGCANLPSIAELLESTENIMNDEFIQQARGTLETFLQVQTSVFPQISWHQSVCECVSSPEKLSEFICKSIVNHKVNASCLFDFFRPSLSLPQELVKDSQLGQSLEVFQFLCPLEQLLTEGGAWSLLSNLAYILTPGRGEEEVSRSAESGSVCWFWLCRGISSTLRCVFNQWSSLNTHG